MGRGVTLLLREYDLTTSTDEEQAERERAEGALPCVKIAKQGNGVAGRSLTSVTTPPVCDLVTAATV